MTKGNRRIRKKEKKVFSFPFKKILYGLRAIVISLVFLGVLGGAGFYGTTLTKDFLNRPIASIVLKGQFEYVSESDMAAVAEAMIGGSFIGENIGRIKDALEAMPWVDSVDLSRRWPDQLDIVVREQMPIARWNDAGFVNVRGEVVLVSDDTHLSDLSVLIGQEEDAALIMQRYSVLASLLSHYDLSIGVLEKNRRGVWQMQLTNQWTLIIGRGGMNEKLQRFTQLLDQKTLHTAMSIKVIDLRYPNGLAVSWKDDKQDIDELDEIIKRINESVHRSTTRLQIMSDKQYARG